MTLRVGIDVGRFPESGRGGLEVYSRNLVAALARTSHPSEFVLYGEGVRIPEGGEGRFRAGFGKGSMAFRPPLIHRQVAIPRAAAADGLDVLHFPFNGGSVWSPVPTVVTVHDLIALIAPGLGAGHRSRPWFHVRRAYHRLALPASIRRARIVLAISQATRDDLVRLLGIPPARIRVVPVAADPAFEVSVGAEESAAWRRRAGLEEPFVMGFASIDPRKNADRLVGAFARLAPPLRRSHLLAVVCTQQDPAPRLRSIAAERGVADRVRLLPFLALRELRCLYREATLLAFPSLYEGFGLPVLEAFWSGTSVLTSRAGGLPEVAGDAAEYVDVLDEDAIARGLTRLMESPARRAELVDRGRRRTALFRWDETARRTLEAYEEAAGARPPRTPGGVSAMTPNGGRSA